MKPHGVSHVLLTRISNVIVNNAVVNLILVNSYHELIQYCETTGIVFNTLILCSDEESIDKYQ